MLILHLERTQHEGLAHRLPHEWQINEIQNIQYNIVFNTVTVVKKKINIETRRSTTLKQRVILVQGPC